MTLVRITVVIALTVMVLAGCGGQDGPQWQLSLSGATASIQGDALILDEPDSWAVAVEHAPLRRGAVISTQRLVTEWSALVADEPVSASLSGTEVSIGQPQVTTNGLTFPATGPQTQSTPGSLVTPYDRTLKYFFDLPPATGWTYTTTFGPVRISGTTITAQFASPAVVAFEGRRYRTLPSSEAISDMTGPAFLVLLDNRTYSAVPVNVASASLRGRTLTFTTRDSAPPAAFNRGALFVDGLPTPA